jgi:hypothetical protein
LTKNLIFSRSNSLNKVTKEPVDKSEQYKWHNLGSDIAKLIPNKKAVAL